MIKMLRLKFICVTMAIVTVLMAVIFGLVIHFTAEALERESLETLRSVASGRFQLVQPEEGREEPDMLYFTVRISHLGQVSTDLLSLYPEALENWITALLTDAQQTGRQSGVLREYHLRFYRTSDWLGEQFVFADISSEQQTLRALTISCLWIGLAAFGAFFGTSLLLTRWMVKPVEQAFQEQRQFVADASHELKTPLTVIMTNAELLQDAEYTDAQRRQFSASILTMSQQMRSLVENLLDLARIDNGAVQNAFDLVDFSALAEDELLPWEPLFFEQSLSIESNIEPGLCVSGSGAHLRQVLNILLDNARKYSAPQGQILLTLRRQGGWAELCVSGPGDPISPADLQNIFKRFYRVDKVRTSGGGYGLGLPIAQAIVLEHAGKIWAESAGGRNLFFVQLPICR